MRLGCEGAPFLLGLVLGPQLEEYFRRAMLLSRGDPLIFLQRPISLSLILATAALLILMTLPSLRKARSRRFRRRKPDGQARGCRGRGGPAFPCKCPIVPLSVGDQMRRLIVAAASCLALLACKTADAQAQIASASPLSERPIMLVVPFAAGGGTDILARLIGDRLRALTSKTVVIDNNPARTA